MSYLVFFEDVWKGFLDFVQFWFQFRISLLQSNMKKRNLW
jgi:hypothetical protein